MILCRKFWPYTCAPYIQSRTSLKHFEQKSPADIILVCSLSIDHLLSPSIRVGGRGLSGKYQKTIWSGIFKHITLVPHISLAYIEFQGKCFWFMVYIFKCRIFNTIYSKTGVLNNKISGLISRISFWQKTSQIKM